MKLFSKNRFLSVVLLISVLALMYVGVFVFRTELNREISDSAETYLFETSNLYASTFRIKLNDQLVMLESQSRYFQNIDLTDYNALKSTIMATKGIGDFKRIAVADSSGTTMNYDGQSSGNIMMKDYFKNAMNGQITVSKSITVDEDGENVLVLAVPIIQDGKAVGVITGTFSQSVLSNLFAVDTFDGEGYAYVINADGTIIVSNEHKNKLIDSDNLYKFIERDDVVSDISQEALSRDVAAGTSNIMRYSYGSQERIVVYSPVGLHDWYVISVMPSSVVSSQTDDISKLVTLLFVFIIAMMSLLALIATILIRRAKIIERDNERYRIVNTQTQSIVFEYDIPTEKLQLTGSTDFLRCGGATLFTGNKCREFLSKKIHQDDMAVRGQMLEFFRGGTDKFSTEIRLLCEGDIYYWFRLQGSLIRNASGEIVKFIGNAVNVDQQIVEELNLKNKAERDLLTGLYNKVTFEEYVSAAVRKALSECVYAFYIIDLDNFKAVNDNLGHAIGDKVLFNTGNTMARIFTEKDLIGRIGGDEFAVLLMLPENAKNSAREIAEIKAKALLTAIDHVYSDDSISIHVTASVGISYFSEHGRNYDELYKNADKALYHSKKNGKNTYTIYDKKMN